jgi:signal transduction histidine kinase
MREADRLSLTVADAGACFDPSESFPGHMGLRSMRERAEHIGAELTIEARLGEGSQINLDWTNK